MAKHNHFARLNEAPIIPPFLVPDAVYLWLLLKQPDTLDPGRDLPRIETEAGIVVDRHIERMARDHNETLNRPQKLSPLIADSTVGLVFDQAAAQHAALAGRYPQKYFGTRLDELRADYPALLHIFTGERSAPFDEVRTLLRSVLPDTPPNHPLRLLHAAWQFRQEVVIRQRPMSMIPVISGEAQGDTPSFTPILQCIGENEWQLGLSGDTAPVSPKVFKGNIDTVLPAVYATYGNWYKRNQAWMERQLVDGAANIDDHIHLPVYARRLQTDRTIQFGAEVSLTNLSHNKLFRLTQPTREQLFHTAADKAVKLALAAAGQPPAAPDAEETKAAYLHLLARRGETAEIRKVTPEAKHIAPLKEASSNTAWTVFVNGQARVTVAWLDTHPRAKAVVSGTTYPARAVILNGNDPPRLGLAPFSFKTKKPDVSDIWSSTMLDGVPLDDEVTRQAVSCWAAWVWQSKAHQKKYQPGGKK